MIFKIIQAVKLARAVKAAVKKRKQQKEQENNMTSVVSGMIRHALTFGGGYLVNTGFLSADEIDVVVGALVTLIGVAWSVYQKRAASE